MEQKILGCLAGVALGDSMGMPSYFSAAQNRRRLGAIEGLRAAPDDHPVHAGMVTGQITDDTQQTLAIADAILSDEGLTPLSVARALIDWYQRIGGDSSPFVGPSSRKAIQALQRGDDPATTGLRGDTNGAAMRVCPVGFVAPGDMDATARAVAVSCLPTHNTGIAMAAAAMVAGFVSACMAGESSLLRAIEAGKEAARVAYPLGADYFGCDLPRRVDLALALVTGKFSQESALDDLYAVLGGGLPAAETVPIAVAVLVLAEGDPWRAAVLAANAGGDADTIGAIAGGMAGAYSGRSAISDDALDTIERVNGLGLARYSRRLAVRLGDTR